MPERPILFLIDGNNQMYRAYHAIRGLTGPDGSSTNAVYGFVTMLRKLIADHEPAYIAAAFDLAGPTFRDALQADYKANRTPMPADLVEQVALVHDACEAMGVRVLTHANYEADDVIATLAMRARRARIRRRHRHRRQGLLPVGGRPRPRLQPARRGHVVRRHGRAREVRRAAGPGGRRARADGRRHRQREGRARDRREGRPRADRAAWLARCAAGGRRERAAEALSRGPPQSRGGRAPRARHGAPALRRARGDRAGGAPLLGARPAPLLRALRPARLQVARDRVRADGGRRRSRVRHLRRCRGSAGVGHAGPHGRRLCDLHRHRCGHCAAGRPRGPGPRHRRGPGVIRATGTHVTRRLPEPADAVRARRHRPRPRRSIHRQDRPRPEGGHAGAGPTGHPPGGHPRRRDARQLRPRRLDRGTRAGAARPRSTRLQGDGPRSAARQGREGARDVAGRRRAHDHLGLRAGGPRHAVDRGPPGHA